jgi:integrase
MVSDTNDVDKYIDNMLNSFLNKQHRKETEDYLFVRERIDKVKNYTRRNDVQSLLTLDKYLKDKPFEKTTQDDMLKWEVFLEKELELQGTTIEQYEAHIKRFYKYLYNKAEYKKGKRFQRNIPYPDNVVWISSNANNYKELPLDKLLTEKQLLKLLNACEQPRDQAIISAAFFDAGLRISEAISLNIRNVGFDNLGGYFILPKKGKDLKTGMRKIRLFIMPSSTKYLKDFLNNHPLKDYPDAPLFYSRDMKTYLKVLDKVHNKTVKQSDFEELRLSRPGLEQLITKHCRMAGIQNITPHMIRHNSCTQSAKKGFNEMEMRIRYGWSPTSKMPSRYTHLASKDLDDKIKVITGFKEPEEPEKSKLVTIICWNCQEENVPTNKFCGKCSANLNPTKEEMTIDATRTGIATQDMLKDKKFREFYNDMLASTWEKYQKMKEKK